MMCVLPLLVSRNLAMVETLVQELDLKGLQGLVLRNHSSEGKLAQDHLGAATLRLDHPVEVSQSQELLVDLSTSRDAQEELQEVAANLDYQGAVTLSLDHPAEIFQSQVHLVDLLTSQDAQEDLQEAAANPDQVDQLHQEVVILNQV